MRPASNVWLAVAGGLLMAAVPASALENPAGVGTIAFADVTVVPMDAERLLTGYTVIVRDGRIVALGPAAETAIPAEAQRIDGRGKYLTPGLADMHTHTWDEDEFVLLLANGVTTIRNMFGSSLQLEWRRQIESGERSGPSLFTAGAILDGADPMWPESTVVENAQQARAAIEVQKAAGYDFVKVYWGLTNEAYDAILEAAKGVRIPVDGHVPDAVGLRHALSSGQRSIEHLTGYEYELKSDREAAADESVWALLDKTRFSGIARLTAASGVWNCPTLVVYESRVGVDEPERMREMFARPEMRFVPPEMREFWLPENTYLKSFAPGKAASSRTSNGLRQQLVKALHDAGARLLLGTDYGNPFVMPGFSAHEELRLLQGAGLTPYEAIATGTRLPAEFLGQESVFGTVEPGKRADLILVDANPLEDVANLAKRSGVMVRGRWHPETELREQLEALAAKYAARQGSGEARP